MTDFIEIHAVYVVFWGGVWLVSVVTGYWVFRLAIRHENQRDRGWR